MLTKAKLLRMPAKKYMAKEQLEFFTTQLKEQKSEIIDGILGADFMKKTNTIIDYKSKNIYLKF